MKEGEGKMKEGRERGRAKGEPKLGSDVISSKKDGRRRRRWLKEWQNFRLFVSRILTSPIR